MQWSTCMCHSNRSTIGCMKCLTIKIVAALWRTICVSQIVRPGGFVTVTIFHLPCMGMGLCLWDIRNLMLC